MRRPVLFLLTVLIASSISGAALTNDPVLAPDGGSQAAYTPHTFNLETSPGEFSFAVTADMRNYSGPGTYDSSQYFRGATEAIADLGGGTFMVSPGDIDPTTSVMWTITQTLGTTYTWYPVVGNHELPGKGHEPGYGDNMAWLRSYEYGPVNPGPSGCPETTYSFDHENAHFVMLNEYCDTAGDTATDGDIPDHLYNWLVADLIATTQVHVFVFGHEPAYPQPDADNGRLRHDTDSLNKYPANRDRFWSLLKSEGVTAYICGHTHNYSAVEVNGVWQVDVGHARGKGDTGARSTFVMVHMDGPVVTFETYRDDQDGGPYSLRHGGTLAAPASLRKEAAPLDDLHNDQTLTYTVSISGPGLSVEMWDPLPTSVNIITSSVTPPAVYSPAIRTVLWEGTLPTYTVQTISFQVTPVVSDADLSPPIVNIAWLSDTRYARLTSFSTIVNARRSYLPLTARD
jgi:hypothetical protein